MASGTALGIQGTDSREITLSHTFGSLIPRFAYDIEYHRRRSMLGSRVAPMRQCLTDTGGDIPMERPRCRRIHHPNATRLAMLTGNSKCLKCDVVVEVTTRKVTLKGAI